MVGSGSSAVLVRPKSGDGFCSLRLNFPCDEDMSKAKCGAMVFEFLSKFGSWMRGQQYMLGGKPLAWDWPIRPYPYSGESVNFFFDCAVSLPKSAN